MDAEPRLRPVRAVASSVVVQGAAMMPAFLTGALAVQLRDDLELSESQLGAAVAFFFLVAAMTSPSAGAFTDRLGARRSLRIASSLTAVSMLGSAVFARSFPTLVALLAIGSFGLAVAGPGTKVMVARGVPVERHGVAFGVQAGAVPFSSFLSGLIVPAIALTLGWRWGYVAASAMAVLGFALLPAVGAPPTTSARTPGRPLGDIDYRPLVMLALAAALGSAAATTLAAFFVSGATETGIDEGLAGALLSVGSACVIVSRIFAGRAADRAGSDPLRSAATLMAISTAGYLLTTTDSRYLFPLGALFALSAGWSISGLLVHAVVRAYTGAPVRATGMISSGLNVGGVVGPLAFGLLVEHYSYRVGFFATAVSTLLGSVAAVAGRRRVEASTAAALA